MNDRSELVARLRASPQERDSFISRKLAVLIPAQVRALRLCRNMTQAQLATASGMAQSQISAIEGAGPARRNLETLIHLASAFQVGLVVKFVPFSEMERWEMRFRADKFDVVPLDEDALFVNPQDAGASAAAAASDRRESLPIEPTE